MRRRRGSWVRKEKEREKEKETEKEEEDGRWEVRVCRGGKVGRDGVRDLDVRREVPRCALRRHIGASNLGRGRLHRGSGRDDLE